MDYYSFIDRSRKDERLSWPRWLTNSGQFSHRVIRWSLCGKTARCPKLSENCPTISQAQDRESSAVKEQRSTTLLRRQRYSELSLQPNCWLAFHPAQTSPRLGSDSAPIFSARSVSARLCTKVSFRAWRFARKRSTRYRTPSKSAAGVSVTRYMTGAGPSLIQTRLLQLCFSAITVIILL